jgi:hypothetical protein
MASPQHRRGNSRLGAFRTLSQHPDWRELTRPAREQFMKRFEVSDPNLSPEQRARLVSLAKSAYFSRIRQVALKKAEAKPPPPPRPDPGTVLGRFAARLDLGFRSPKRFGW